ncbi:hypothetical protein NUACC21_11870 [Scytonema sp. NUACC21]
MLAIKGKNIASVTLGLVALVYSTTVSHVDVHPFLKGETILIPLQLLALIYVTYWRWSNLTKLNK